MRRIAVAVALALTAALAAAPAEAKGPGARTQTYDITRAEGSIRISFRGDEAAGCRNHGVCTLSGTTTYAFGGQPRSGRLYWARYQKRTIAFYGFFETAGRTASDVVSAGGEEHCIDTAEHEYETVAFEPRSQRVRFDWRERFTEESDAIFIGAGGDPFDTRCAGPHLVDLEPSHAVPFADVPYRVFRSPKASFRTTGSRPFAGGGFAGTVDWDLRYGFRHRGRAGGGFVPF